MPLCCSRVIVFFIVRIICAAIWRLVNIASNKDPNIVSVLPHVQYCQTLICIQDFQTLDLFLKVVVSGGAITITKPVQIFNYRLHAALKSLMTENTPAISLGEHHEL